MNVVPAKIPVFDPRKIYFPSDFQQNFKNVRRDFRKRTRSSNNLLKVYPCDSYNFKNKAFLVIFF